MIIVNDCEWNHPGANPFGGNIPAAVAHYLEIPAAARVELRAKMRRHAFDDQVEIRRDAIRGRDDYTDLRSMHFGTKLCKTVSRAKWSDAAVERGLIYCSGPHCVVVPSVCSNVSLITRIPRAPPSPPASPPAQLQPDLPPRVLEGPTPDVPSVVGPTQPEGPVDSASPVTWWPGPTPIIFLPPGYMPASPIPVSPIAVVPEPATWWLIAAGIAVISAHRRRS